MAGVIAWFLVAVVAGEAADGVPAYFTRVRGADDDMNRRIEHASARSETFRALVESVQQSNAIVVIESGRCHNGRYRSCLVHVEGNAVARSIRILVDTRVAEDRLMATI